MIDLKNYPTKFLCDLLPLIHEEIKIRNKQDNRLKRIKFIESLKSLELPMDDVKARILDFNSSDFYLPPNMERPCFTRSQYLKSLLKQDWSHLFPEKENSSSDYYVYIHTDPSDKVFVTDVDSGGNYCGMPFYVGKGIGNRAYDLKRNQGHGKKIKEVLDKGYEKKDIVKIVFSGLSESKALEIESKLILFFGSIYERKKGASLYNLDIPPRPKFNGLMAKFPSKGGAVSEELPCN